MNAETYQGRGIQTRLPELLNKDCFSYTVSDTEGSMILRERKNETLSDNSGTLNVPFLDSIGDRLSVTP